MKGVLFMDFEKVITERYSVRKFENRHLEKEITDKILHAGLIAPTGCNYQPQKILVLNTDEAVEKLKKCTPCHFDAPCAMLVCYSEDETWTRPCDGAKSAPVDASIVTTHMMLEAHNLGIGACWIMFFDPEKMRETFKIPSNVIPHALLVMGYPHKDSSPSKMHFCFKEESEIVFYESF